MHFLSIRELLCRRQYSARLSPLISKAWRWAFQQECPPSFPNVFFFAAPWPFSFKGWNGHTIKLVGMIKIDGVLLALKKHERALPVAEYLPSASHKKTRSRWISHSPPKHGHADAIWHSHRRSGWPGRYQESPAFFQDWSEKSSWGTMLYTGSTCRAIYDHIENIYEWF